MKGVAKKIEGFFGSINIASESELKGLCLRSCTVLADLDPWDHAFLLSDLQRSKLISLASDYEAALSLLFQKWVNAILDVIIKLLFQITGSNSSILYHLD